MRFIKYINEIKEYIVEAKRPELKDGEYAVRMAGKQKVRALNKKTNRMKNFKRDKWIKTTVPPEERTFKNLPRYADGKEKIDFKDWLEITGNPGWGCDGKCYGWSHRAVHGFGVGDIIKKDYIGNKYQYSEEAQKKYNDIMNKEGYEAADKYYNSIQFEPYTIKTKEEAFEHATRFRDGVS